MNHSAKCFEQEPQLHAFRSFYIYVNFLVNSFVIHLPLITSLLQQGSTAFCNIYCEKIQQVQIFMWYQTSEVTYLYLFSILVPRTSEETYLYLFSILVPRTSEMTYLYVFSILVPTTAGRPEASRN